jgi:hypothetical protein
MRTSLFFDQWSGFDFVVATGTEGVVELGVGSFSFTL